MDPKNYNLPHTDIEKVEDVELHKANTVRGYDLVHKEEDATDKTVEGAASACHSFCSDIGYMKLEIVLFLYIFSSMMISISSTTMILDKACVVHFKYSEDICRNLSEYPDMKTTVEKFANNYSLGRSLLTSLPSAIAAVFLGSWSDKYGRKIPLIIALTGAILGGLGSTMCAFLFYSRIEYFFIPALFSGCSGGLILVLTVIYSYVADTTLFDKRTIKYALTDMSFDLAMPLGTLAGGWLYKFTEYNYTYVFLTSTAGHVLALVWAMYAITETKGLDNQDSWRVKFRRLWSFQQVIDGFTATTKKRVNKGKEQIIWLIIAMSCAVLSNSSTISVNYFYVHHLYDWGNTQYSTVSAVFSFLGVIAMLICVPLFKILNLEEPSLGLVGSVSLLIKNMGTGLATTTAIYYFSNVAGLLSGLCLLAGRSRISKVASKNDIGKIFAFITTANSLLPILFTVVAAQIFNATLNIFPGLVYILMGILILLPVGVFLWLTRLPEVNYDLVYNNSEECEKMALETYQKQ